MILPRRLSAVILDMDGTLHDTEAVYHRRLPRWDSPLRMDSAIRSSGFQLWNAT
jgi:phosphoglycolate phosphatase-like HAD superfamily hydrolase